MLIETDKTFALYLNKQTEKKQRIVITKFPTMLPRGYYKLINYYTLYFGTKEYLLTQ